SCRARTTSTARSGRSRWRRPSAIARSRSRCCPTPGTPPITKRRRRPCAPSPTSPTGCCATTTRAISPRILNVPRSENFSEEAMAETERKLSNGGSRIDFQTDPSKYRHWKLKLDGDVATLLMDVDEKGALFEGYELKLNSYDLGVDIELADAIERLRFEHPQVKVVLLRSAKPRVFCAGANIRMLAG